MLALVPPVAENTCFRYCIFLHFALQPDQLPIVHPHQTPIQVVWENFVHHLSRCKV